MKKFLIPVILSALAVPLFAYVEPMKTRKPAVQGNMKHSKTIGAATILINNFDQFQKEWFSTSTEHTPYANEVSTVKTGETIHLITFFSDCSPNKKNKCNMSYRTRIFKDGTLIFTSKEEKQEVEFLGNSLMQLSSVVLASNFDANETGNYSFEVTVYDNNAKDFAVVKTGVKVTL